MQRLFLIFLFFAYLTVTCKSCSVIKERFFGSDKSKPSQESSETNQQEEQQDNSAPIPTNPHHS